MENLALREAIVHAELSKYLSSAEELIEEARNGRMFILVDDEDRENEGDLVIPAQFATPDAINFMARYARGLICLALTQQRVEKLGLPLMSQQNGTRHQTAFTVSIEAREGLLPAFLPLTARRRSRWPSSRTARVTISPRRAMFFPCSRVRAALWSVPDTLKHRSISRAKLVSIRLRSFVRS